MNVPMNVPLQNRMTKEVKALRDSPPPGVTCWALNGSLRELRAVVKGPDGSVYEKGFFELSVHIPDRYPFEPPKLRFVTQIYHLNIDTGGRICLDLLNMPPKGAWRPALHLAALLASIPQLLVQPNPDDGLDSDMTMEFVHNRAAFDAKARAMTAQHASQDPGLRNPAKESDDVTSPSEAAVTVEGSGQMSDIKRRHPKFPAAAAPLGAASAPNGPLGWVGTLLPQHDSHRPRKLARLQLTKNAGVRADAGSQMRALEENLAPQ